MSAVRRTRGDTVAGFLCALSLLASGLAVVRQPALLASFAVLTALAASVMSDVHRRLAGIAVAVAALAFFVGMSIAVWADTSLL